MRRHGSVLMAAVAVGGVLAAVACGGVPRADPAAAARGATTQIAGGSRAQRRLLREILAALPSRRLSSVRIAAVRGGVVLRAPVRSAEPTWDLLVLGETFSFRSADEHLPRVVGVRSRAAGWPTSDLGRRPARATAHAVRTARHSLRRLVRASGARVARLAVTRPDGLAAIVDVRVTDAARFLRGPLRRLATAARARVGDAAGLLIAVDDARGRAWLDADSGLGGIHFVRPALRGCDPFPTPGPAPASGLPRCASTPTAAPGRITGAIRFTGGPPGTHIEQRRQGGRVALERHGRTVAGTRVRRGHGFVLSAPPGRYRLVGRSGSAVCPPRTVSVHSDATQRADVVCDIR